MKGPLFPLHKSKYEKNKNIAIIYFGVDLTVLFELTSLTRYSLFSLILICVRVALPSLGFPSSAIFSSSVSSLSLLANSKPKSSSSARIAKLMSGGAGQCGGEGSRCLWGQRTSCLRTGIRPKPCCIMLRVCRHYFVLSPSFDWH